MLLCSNLSLRFGLTPQLLLKRQTQEGVAYPIYGAAGRFGNYSIWAFVLGTQPRGEAAGSSGCSGDQIIALNRRAASLERRLTGSPD